MRLYLFLLLPCFHLSIVYSSAQQRTIVKPSISIDYFYFPSSELSDSSGRFSNQTTQLGVVIPIWNHARKLDTINQKKSRYFQLLAHASGKLAFPKLTNEIQNQILNSTSAGLTGILRQNRKNIFSVSLLAISRNDETTILNPTLRYSALVMYRRMVNEGFSFNLGTGYSYIFGRGILYPALGVRFKTGKRSIMTINFPSRISFIQRLGKKALLTAYLKPQGGFYYLSNATPQIGAPNNYYFRQRENHLGIGLQYRMNQNFNLSVDGGFAFNRKANLSEGLERKSINYFSSKIDNGVYFGIRLKYIFNKKVVKQKADQQEEERINDDLLADPDFYDLISD